MTRRYTAEEASALVRRAECWERGSHVLGLRSASPYGVPSPFDQVWYDELQTPCMNCDALVSVEYPGPLGIEVEG